MGIVPIDTRSSNISISSSSIVTEPSDLLMNGLVNGSIVSTICSPPSSFQLWLIRIELKEEMKEREAQCGWNRI